MQRRTFLKWSVGSGTLTALGMLGWGCSREDGGGREAVRLPSLPYAQNALEPYISEETIQFHYGKHHRGYVENANRLVNGTALEKLSLVDIMRRSHQSQSREQNPTFNNAAQVFNHTFYWNSLKPDGGGAPKGLMAEWVDKSFGSYDRFRQAYADAAAARFASGWIWLVLNDGRIEIMATANAETPVVLGLQPLLVLDVWEHAYYVDYRNRRDAYVEAFLDHLVNWDFAANNLGAV